MKAIGIRAMDENGDLFRFAWRDNKFYIFFGKTRFIANAEDYKFLQLIGHPSNIKEPTI